MEQRLSLVTLAARDLKTETAFYERLGWKVAFSNEHVAFFQLNGVVLSLWRRDQFAREAGVAEADVRPGGSALAYNARTREEVDAVFAAARAAGARIVRPAHDADWGGYTGLFADPEGHLWEVAWNPAWSIGPDGAVRM